ncbi:MAG: hypothetical protein A2836_02400 [Candidatus Taylorbacteria bacterium RIFCSPHIGHO2_01_FULL_45_63]|uniref:Uncharacterized protein n=1 Tax=Candidatus Taylorbacteria bacterium RIFCSPHIGHO2_02_FULL_45_35 TaxID=1802311 RepID=A0A1G2MVJ2_9BACT|nr:MAG: hypothetical protein A2836_02400 [Candidatus Taylorbacteria bacterium RIFCSPHIGHO2_01_FULL_45_63]OHA27880.1 MAG: hypothetical protein A3D56_01535 [Candidatus Taylorbacteria bacterium RIFCSPHIGHO2_02_FULL_45_35]OHA32442.1 MAG: hypothetical protein A3A22_01100 [Candidatus Taylorbacteria bacterium RIFCSPLOWO2_01_FULL_45_34b]
MSTGIIISNFHFYASNYAKKKAGSPNPLGNPATVALQRCGVGQTSTKLGYQESNFYARKKWPSKEQLEATLKTRDLVTHLLSCGLALKPHFLYSIMGKISKEF